MDVELKQRVELQQLEPGARARRVALSCYVFPSVVVAHVDGHRLRQVLMNVILNAVDAADRRPGGRVEVTCRGVDGKVVFDVADDPRFERDGEDLYTEVLVSYPQLVLGADIDVPTVTSRVSVRIPPGTQSGQVVHLRGRGLPRVNSSGSGDLHVRVQLWTPERVSREEEALLQQLLAHTQAPPEQARSKGFWSKMKEALGA